MDDARFREHLRQFGLSDAEAETYLVVLRHGVATAGTVADEASVSRSYVYTVCERLAARGLVVIDEGSSPTRLRAVSPSEAIGTLSDHLQALEVGIGERYAEADDTPLVEVIRSRRTLIARLRAIVDDAAHEVFLSVPERALSEVREPLSDAVDRGVLVSLLVTDPAVDDLSETVTDCATLVREWRATPPVVATADARIGVMAESGLLVGRHGPEQAVSLGQRQLVTALYEAFIGNYWPVATERFVADPLALPCDDVHFRIGFLSAAIHLDAGRDLLASVTATDVETGEKRRFERVPVVAARQSLVEPVTATFPAEHSLVLDTDEGDVTVGGVDGVGAFFETYATETVSLYEA